MKNVKYFLSLTIMAALIPVSCNSSEKDSTVKETSKVEKVAKASWGKQMANPFTYIL